MTVRKVTQMKDYESDIKTRGRLLTLLIIMVIIATLSSCYATGLRAGIEQERGRGCSAEVNK